MLITLYGPDSYRRIKKVNEIVGEYRKKYTGLSYERIDVSLDDSLEKLRNFVSTRAMFDKAKLLVIDNPLEAKDQKKLREVLKSNAKDKETTIVINSTQKPPATYKFAYEAPSTSQEFPALKGEKIGAFVTQISKEYGVNIDAKTKSIIVDIFGSDTWGIATEINRLSLEQSGIVESRIKTDYFQLINTVKRGYSAKDRIVALELILSERKDDPARVFNSLAYRLLNEKEANRFADYDIAVKSGKLEYEEVLLDLALGPTPHSFI